MQIAPNLITRIRDIYIYIDQEPLYTYLGFVPRIAQSVLAGTAQYNTVAQEVEVVDKLPEVEVVDKLPVDAQSVLAGMAQYHTVALEVEVVDKLPVADSSLQLAGAVQLVVVGVH